MFSNRIVEKLTKAITERHTYLTFFQLGFKVVCPFSTEFEVRSVRTRGVVNVPNVDFPLYIHNILLLIVYLLH